MATLPGLTVQLLDAAWQLALLVIPLLYLGFLGYGLARNDISIATVITSQRSYTLHVGVYTVAGLLAGGVPVLTLGSPAGVLIGGAAVFAATVYRVSDSPVPEPTPLDLDAWPDRVKLPWLAVPLLAAAAVATGNTLVQSVTALVFLSAVFWEV